MNIGKFNIGPASIGVAEHCFYEAITHAANRVLYGMRVTDMPHVRRNFMDAWLRLVGMKLYQRRASDYFRSASETDRRYLLYNPTSKMKVTLQAEEVINLLWDVIAAKGFEKDTYFSMGAVDIRGPSKLEGTVHVNVQLIRKFMPNYFFNPAEYPPVPPALDGRLGGKQVLNILPAGGPHKGLAVEEVRVRQACDTAVYVGDDETDEDVFALGRPGRLLAIRVGRRRGYSAAYYIRTQAEIDRLMERMLALRPPRPTPGPRSARRSRTGSRPP